jgi:acetylornithine deacetylase
MIADPAFETDTGAAVVRTAQQVLEGMGLQGTPTGVPFGSDASKLARHGVPSIIFGPGSIDRAHAAVAYVECAQVARATAFYSRFLMDSE